MGVGSTEMDSGMHEKAREAGRRSVSTSSPGPLGSVGSRLREEVSKQGVCWGPACAWRRKGDRGI